jgi:ribosomal protein S4
MLRNNQKRLLLIRRFKKDLLGICALKRKLSILKFFLLNLIRRKTRKRVSFFRILIIERPIYNKPLTKYGKYFLKRQQFRLFFSFIKIKQIRRIVKKSIKKKNAVNSFIYYMESRLDVILFRLHLFPSIRMARQFILHGNVFINGKIKKSYSYNLKENDILSFSSDFVLLKKKEYISNILEKKILYTRIPNYLEFCLDKFLFVFTEINVFDVYFFFKLNITTYYSLINFYRKCLF